MKKEIIVILLTVIMTSMVTANCAEVVAGESCTIEIDELDPNEDIYYTVTDNSSNLEGMNVSINNSNATLSFDKRYKPDSFTIIFMNKQEKVIYKHHHSSEGTDTEIKYKNNTINNTEIIEVEKPYFNESECPEPEPQEPKTRVVTRVVEQYWQEAILSVLLLAAVIFASKQTNKLRKLQQSINKK